MEQCVSERVGPSDITPLKDRVRWYIDNGYILVWHIVTGNKRAFEDTDNVNIMSNNELQYLEVKGKVRLNYHNELIEQVSRFLMDKLISLEGFSMLDLNMFQLEDIVNDTNDKPKRKIDLLNRPYIWPLYKVNITGEDGNFHT